MSGPWTFACPRCQGSLEAAGPDTLRCPQDGLAFPRQAGIWRFLPPDRARFYARFLAEYETVRRAEGRAIEDSATFRALPFPEPSHPLAGMWRQRAQSFAALLAQVVAPLEQARKGQPLRILDLGAGNGWLSYRLAQRGHVLAGVDLAVNDWDGLGAHVHYDCPFTPIQAEFDALPLAPAQADLLIFNASFHYARDYAKTLAEAWRVLAPGGLLAILDTPVYHDPESGRRMVQEREAGFQERFGFPSNALASRNFLTYQELAELGRSVGIRWRLLWPTPRWRWAVRRARAWLRGQREPAQFPLILGRKG